MNEFEQFPYEIMVPAGTELDGGHHEDSDPVVAKKSIILQVLGPEEHGALPVQIVENGEPIDCLYFYHQPRRAA